MKNPNYLNYHTNTKIVLRNNPSEEGNLSKCCIWEESENIYGDTVNLSKCSIRVERENFYGTPSISNNTKKRKKSKNNIDDGRYVIIGFDTEFKTPDVLLTPEDIKLGFAKYEVISYQVHLKVFGDTDPFECRGICFPVDGKRLSLGDILLFSFWTAIQSGFEGKFSPNLYLVGHFTRADVPALSDFRDLTETISNVRNTFLSTNQFIPVRFHFDGDDFQSEFTVRIRDTMLLTPSASKSLRALGDLVGVEKVTLDSDPARELFYKTNMNVLLRDDPDLFERYALTDSTICVRYIERLLERYEELTGNHSIPPTLTSIGVDLLLKSWIDEGRSPLAILGKEEHTESVFDKRKQYFRQLTKAVDKEQVFWHSAFVTETYHGGRNEQFWFGPGFEDNWTDYDLSAAYPTAMSLIGMPDWDDIRITTDPKDFTPTTLGFAAVTFEFPDNVRFPTLPVRTENGLVFPKKGDSNCSAPEIFLALSLGATIRIRHGIVVPTNPAELVFGDFIKMCLDKRKASAEKFGKKSLDALFWKELSNSTYGKTAQGLREKRVFDMRDKGTKPLPPSKITNAYFASFITSFVRAVLGEVLNSLPETVCVFSTTTDGFLTNATAKDIATACKGTLVSLYGNTRKRMTGKSDTLESKHFIRKPLGWRTRGQATLLEGKSENGDEMNIVLAKGGIFTPSAYDGVREQNDMITNLFFNRTPEAEITATIKTGVREMVMYDADLVEKSLTKHLNMEYDWKRCPTAVGSSPHHNHLVFNTKPWTTVDEFQRVRTFWEDFTNTTPRCLKTVDDFRHFAEFVKIRSVLGEKKSVYLRKNNPDITRLRQSLCSAWNHSTAGLIYRSDDISNSDFAIILSECGIPCSRANVENGKKKNFERFCVPPTFSVIESLNSLKTHLPKLDIPSFLSSSAGEIDLMSSLDGKCVFVQKSSR